MQQQATTRSSTDHADRTKIVDERMRELALRFSNADEFTLVHPARWRHHATGHHVETGYSYGEGRLRVFLDGKRTEDADFVISGREDDLDEFNKLFPVSSK